MKKKQSNANFLRLVALAKETHDITTDQFFGRDGAGYACKLCRTLHKSEDNYLAHVVSKKHQRNLAQRNFFKAKKRKRIDPAIPTIQELRAGESC